MLQAKLSMANPGFRGGGIQSSQRERPGPASLTRRAVTRDGGNERRPRAKRDRQPKPDLADNCVPTEWRRMREPRLKVARKMDGIPPRFEDRTGAA